MCHTVFHVPHSTMLEPRCSGSAWGQQADLVVSNAHIYTLDEAHPIATRVAVRGDRIVALIPRWMRDRSEDEENRCARSDDRARPD